MISNPIPWPGGARCAVAITWDMDADSSLHWYQRERADTLVASQSQVRYGPLIAIPRLVDIFRAFEQRHTFFIPGWCLERYSDAVHLLQQGGHEIALHGYLHERPNELSADDERHWLERGIRAFERVVGTRPRGWRAPSFAFSKHSLGYLLENGFAYDSSLMGDDIPYLLEGSAGDLVELPTQWTLDDWPHYMHSGDFNYRMPISAPARALEVFRAEFDAAWKYGGLWISVWHPFVTGRLSRLDAMIALIDYMVAKGGVWFARLDQITDHVRSLMADGTWQPRREPLPLYDSPIAELRREGR